MVYIVPCWLLLLLPLLLLLIALAADIGTCGSLLTANTRLVFWAMFVPWLYPSNMLYATNLLQTKHQIALIASFH